jgi:hypothetical protein
MDTLTGRLLVFSNENCSNYVNESLVDSLRANLNDSVKYCSRFINMCTDTSQVTLFGFLRKAKKFVFAFGGGSHWSYTSIRYVQGFGVYYYISSGSGPFGSAYTEYTLKGCIINGILYGDTSIYIGIRIINNSTPVSYRLYDNYPNPFNPITKIQFDLPKSTQVKLIIYDILGREIETLVNENKKPGTYEVDWNGSRYSSGVYFYRLITDDYVETKKMVLVK